MVKVAQCESFTQQYDPTTGGVFKGYYNPKDIGLFQINQDAWGATEVQLGVNVDTLQGNLEMAQYILKTQGLNAWIYSYPCWGKRDA